MSQLVLGFALLGCGGAYAAWQARHVLRWATKMACPRCGKYKLVVEGQLSRASAPLFRCTACRTEYHRHAGQLIERTAWEAGAREPFPKAELRRPR
jgi:transposase-like protein